MTGYVQVEETAMRRLPVYLLIDCSESMIGKPLRGVQNGMAAMLAALRRNPYALETVYLSIITFDSKARLALPLTEIPLIHPPNLAPHPGTRLGSALALLRERMEKDVVFSTSERKGDFRPLVFILTDGQPTDEWKSEAMQLKSMKPRPANIYGIGCGEEVDIRSLTEMSDVAFHMSDMSEDSFGKFFIWMSASVQTVSQNAEGRVDLSKIPIIHEIQAIDRERMPLRSTFMRQVFLHVRCRLGKYYMLRYARRSDHAPFVAKDVNPLPESFFDAGLPSGPSVNSNMLTGALPCPYCQSAGWGHCGNCRQLFCYDGKMPVVFCPHCKEELTMSGDSSFNVSRSIG